MTTACTHTYNTPKNRLLSAGSENFTYDNEGQLATGYATDYSFDYEHRLVGIGAAVQYQYDGIGNRLAATRNGVTTRYVYDLNGNLIAEADAANTITRYYIHGIGLMAMVTPANTTYCYHFNQIGSTVAMTDMNKAMVNQYAYTPFGTIANQMETISQPFTYVGQMGVMAEPNGFYSMRARYYNPAVRRFISEDPIGFDGGDLNLYAYVGNNPMMLVDPSGESPATAIAWLIIRYGPPTVALARRYGPPALEKGKELVVQAWNYIQAYGPEIAITADHLLGSGTKSPWPGPSSTKQVLAIARKTQEYLDEYIGNPLQNIVNNIYDSRTSNTPEKTIPLPEPNRSLPTSTGYQIGSWRKLF